MAQALEYNHQSKFLVIMEPLQQLPHKCVACYRYGSGDIAKPLGFIDFNMEIEFYGKVFICLDCVTEMANQHGYASPDQISVLKEHNDVLQISLEAEQQKNEVLSNALAGFRSVFGTSADDTATPYFPDEGESGGPEELPDINPETTGTEPELTEQTDESGSTDVRDDVKLSDFL